MRKDQSHRSAVRRFESTTFLQRCFEVVGDIQGCCCWCYRAGTSNKKNATTYSHWIHPPQFRALWLEAVTTKLTIAPLNTLRSCTSIPLNRTSGLLSIGYQKSAHCAICQHSSLGHN
ncbi:hypothetical protein IQ06DRAFT_129585 [Phaeosphaeriaceae sp. SRC1lsM3a]|nr:hypothetical protein IQ06DRAFT_129585 [Stagonospora sp. SRC1lsM3a]